MEVLTPGKMNVWQDRESKRQLYATQGVQEYWIVDPLAQAVDIYRLQSDAWSLHAGELVLVDQVDKEHALVSALLPLFQCKVASLFCTLAPRA